MNLDAIRNKVFAPIEHRYEARDTILYALGLGFAEDPLDEAELPFVYERDLRAVPSMANVLAHPGFWARDAAYGIDWVRLLHAEQEFTLFAPLPASGGVRGEYRVAGVEDKGEDRGALLHQEKLLFDIETGERLAVVRSTLFMRGDGGQGGFGEAVSPAKPLPAREPDRSLHVRTAPSQALLYRLSGDWNPLHADPEIARRAGFERPILHGLCTNGVACRAILAQYCDYEPSKLKGLFTRFSGPVFPGELIRFDFFEEHEGVSFRAVSEPRGDIVLDRCRATFTR